MIDFNSFVSIFKGFASNPMQYLAQRNLGLSENALKNPQAAVQELLNSGKMSQAQFNQLQAMAKQIQNNPQFSKMFGK